MWILAIKEPAGGLVFEVVGVMKEVLLGVEAVGFGSEADRGEATARRRRGTCG